jgi:hypothetical protein
MKGKTMKASTLTTIATLVLAVSAAGVHASANAQFSLKNPLAGATGGGGSSAAPANAGQVLRNTRDALLSFTNAQVDLLAALGGYENLAAQRELLAAMKSGDAAAAKKEELETIVKISKESQDEIDKKVVANAKLDAQQKSLAGKAMVEYVKGLSSTRKMATSVQDLAKNPASLMGEAGTAVYAAKEVPAVAAGAAGTTTKLVSYLSANGVATPKDDLGK